MKIASRFSFPVTFALSPQTKLVSLSSYPFQSHTLPHCILPSPYLRLFQFSIYKAPSMASKHSQHFTKKRKKIVFEEDEEQNLTLRRCSIEYKSSSKHFKSGRKSSYQKQTNESRWDKDCSSSSSCWQFRRKWTYSDEDCSEFRDKLVVVSYNILGVENASKHPHLYFNVPHKYLSWDHRRTLLCKELTQYDPSILCCQEVDRYSDLHDVLQQNGFKGAFKARTGDAQDGCAIFWKDERFTLLHEENIEFQSFGLRNNVAQFCVLEMNGDRLNSDLNLSKAEVATSRSLVVGNIHMLFNPKSGDIKLGQIRLFLEKAHRLSVEWGRIPVILAGDLNSVPQSAIYQFISSAKLDILQHDRKKMSGQFSHPFSNGESFRCSHFVGNGGEMVVNGQRSKFVDRQRPTGYKWDDKEVKLATGDEQVTCLQHPLKLYSAYLGIPGNDRTRDSIGEPLATSCHSKFMGTVDYIWHSEALVPVRVLETIPVNVLQSMGRLPNKNWGSDHLALVCEFAFKQ